MLKSTTFEIGKEVRRNQPGDYTHNREGIIIAVDLEKNRCQVNWTRATKKTGEYIGRKLIITEIENSLFTVSKPIKTWVNFKGLILI